MKRFIASIMLLLATFATSAQADKTVFSDGNPPSVRGTIVTADWLNSVQNHRHDGGNNDGSAPMAYAADFGSANACQVNLTPALTAHVTGMPIGFKVAANNTGATTVQFNSLSAVSLRNALGNALVAGDLVAGQIVQVAYDGTYYRMISAGMMKSQADGLYATAAQGAKADAALPASSYTRDDVMSKVNDMGSTVNYATNSGYAYTATNSSGTGTLPKTTESGLRIIRGIYSSGTIIEGSGFTISSGSTGQTTVTFNSAFSDVPSIVVSSRNAAGIASSVNITSDYTSAGFSTQAYSISAGSVTAYGAVVHFIAIGPN